MASINNVVTVALLPEGQAAARDNMNVCAVITGNQGVLSTGERYRLYKNASAVSQDFGASSIEAAYANTFFDTTPNPVSVGGVLVMGYWRASDEDVAASSATLLGEQLSEAATIPALNEITDGSFSIDVDGVTQEVTALDFTTVSEISDVAEILDTAITGATVVESNSSLLITSATTGVTSTLTYLTAATSGTDVSAVLGLNAGAASVLTQGADADTLTGETKLEGIAAIKAKVNFKGACFIDDILDAEVPGLASWAGANAVIMCETFDDATYLEKAASNPVWAVKLAGQTSFRCLYSKAGNRKLSATYMARTHTVNFSGENTANTLNLKTLSVPAEAYSETEVSKAYTVGLDIYTTIKDVSVVLTSPANGFVDQVYNTTAFIDAVQTDTFNYLKTTPTKIPQTEPGIDGIEDSVEKTCEGFVRAGVYAPGTWTLPDFFGDQEQFLSAVAAKGYYVLAGELADQPTSERQERISPVIQVAVKDAGAVHKCNIIIFNNK